METIFDHDVTEEELKQLFASSRLRELRSAEEYKREFENEGVELPFLIHLYWLFRLRGDENNLKRIESKLIKTVGEEVFRYSIAYEDLVQPKEG